MQKYVDGELVELTPDEILARARTAEEMLAFRQAEARLICRLKILEVVDETAQINLAAAAGADALNAEQKAVYQSGVAWINQMRATWKALAADLNADLDDDANWPQPTQAMIDLANAF